MTDHTETLIKATLQRQADRAVDPSVLFAGLETARSPRRTGRLLVGAAAVVVLVLVAGIFLVTRDEAAPVVATPPPPARPTFSQQGMAYEPGWLPEGLVEQHRTSDPRAVARIWRPVLGGHQPGPIVMVMVFGYPPVSLDGAHAIDVNGVPGHIASKNGRTDLIWQPRPNIWLQVAAQGAQDRDVAVHVAKSMRSDGTEQVHPLVEFGWCPYHDFSTSTSGVDPAHAGGVFRCIRMQKPQATVTITLSPGSSAMSGEKVTVRGRPGWYEGTERGVIVLLADGRYMTVAAWTGDAAEKPLSKADLIRVADTAVIHDAAYVDWIGTR